MGNAYTALGVCDSGVIVVNAEYGVEVGTQNIFRVTNKLNKPVVFALNHMDGEKVDFDNMMDQLREHFGSNVMPVQYPLNAGANFNSMIDVLLMKKYEWGPDGGVPKVTDVPADQLDKAQEMHDALLEAAASNDEELMEKEGLYYTMYSEQAKWYER